MRPIWIVLVVAMGLVAGSALADHRFGRQVRFAGAHPIPKSEGGGMCYIEGPHVHIYAANKLEYRVHGDDHVFVGDPVAYNWDGPRYAYKGPHPIHVNVMYGDDGDDGVEYCYIQGPHYHYFAPPPNDDFKMVGNAYFYVGTPSPVFVEQRPTYVGINAYYDPLVVSGVYARPVVEVEAPVGWIGMRADWGVAPVVVDHRRAVVVGAPGAVIEGGVGVVVPTPSVHFGVQIGGPAVIVHDRPSTVIIEHDHDRHVDEGHHGHGRGHR